MWPFKRTKEDPKWHTDYAASQDCSVEAPSSPIRMPESFCCFRFSDAVSEGEIVFAYEDAQDIDETQWYMPGRWHLYFCPFCGTNVKGLGFGDYDTESKQKLTSHTIKADD